MAVDTKNIQSYHGLKEKGNKGKVTLKLFKRKDEDKIQQKKKKTKNIDHKRSGLSSSTKVFVIKACVAITSYFGQMVRNYFWKKRLHRFGLQMER